MADILIVGAGPTGLTAALSLAALGITPRIIEARTNASNLSRAVGLLPGSMTIFDHLGIAERVRGEAVTIEEARILRDGHLAVDLRLDADPDPNVRLLSLPQDRTEAILAEALAERGVTVEYGKACKGLIQDESGVTVAIEGGEEIRAHEVLGADGAKSAVRQALGLKAEGIELPEDWSIADVELAEPVPPATTIHLNGAHDAVFMIPMERSRVRLVSNTSDALATFGPGLAIARVRREAKFRISVKQVPTYRVGHVALAGDAAHTHSPVGGRGMNLGIDDAAHFAEALSDGSLAGYSAARHAVGAHTIGLSERARKTLLGGSGTRRTVGVTLMRLASRNPALARKLARTIILG
ncbi:FAD-dependent monooxygenase [Acuticoccus sp. MNP-M23]|uniref:FAD-dependent oxidoreductase n=1 Tax=Acuticoccus sp. MNP-M23 TaxID=3072793 RepID=UPI0028163D63|nr:FAD-dependent monooxygenase [Acuticoccus sp. MNP-M23]WMS41006.1 FAD-dependent monooxygenase [Acuticoccus sp. MNP-M23]